MGEVPDSLPLTEETRDRLAAQANQLGAPVVVRLIDLLAVAVDDMRQGGDPRLPLELALVKVTRPAADMSREALAFRLDQLERGRAQRCPGTVPETAPVETSPAPAAEPPSVELEQLQEAWQRTVLPAVSEKSIPTASMLTEARPVGLVEDTLTIEFPPTASFHRKLAEEPKNSTLLRDALYELTGRKVALDVRARRGRRSPPRRMTTRRRGKRRSTSSSRKPSTRRRSPSHEHGSEQADAAGAADAGGHAEGAGGDGERDGRGQRRRRRRHRQGDGHRERSSRSRSRRRRSTPRIPRRSRTSCSRR